MNMNLGLFKVRMNIVGVSTLLGRANLDVRWITRTSFSAEMCDIFDIVV